MWLDCAAVDVYECYCISVITSVYKGELNNELILFSITNVSITNIKQKKGTAPYPQFAKGQNKKGQDKGKLVPVWRNMTVLELADAMDKSLDHIFEVMIYVENTEDYDQPWKCIDNPKVIYEVVKFILPINYCEGDDYQLPLDVLKQMGHPLPLGLSVVKKFSLREECDICLFLQDEYEEEQQE